MTLSPWLHRHPLLGYYAAVFIISWGGILIVMGARGVDLVLVRPIDAGLIFAAMLLGPCVSGLVMTSLLEGRVGLSRVRASLVRWRVNACWYGVALLTMPLLLISVLRTLSAVASPAYAPHFQWQLFAIGFVAGIFEEIGWTGFATPRLLASQRLFKAGLSLGLTWAVWHLLVDFRQNFNTLGVVWLLEFLVLYVAALTAYRMLMMWVYTNTQSLLLAVMMHASYTGWLFVLYPATSFTQGLVWQSGLAVALWVVVAVVMRAVAHRRYRQGNA